MTHHGTRTIETDRLLLRPFRPTDVEPAYRNWLSDPEVTKFLRWKTHTDISVSRRLITEWSEKSADPSFYQWAIELKSIGEPIGTISVVGRNDELDIVHIGYCIGSRWWLQGITTEAFRALIPFFFNEVGANRIECQHDPNNPNSGAVMRKCGMTYEGTLRKADRSNRGVVDACIYSLLRSEWNGE